MSGYDNYTFATQSCSRIQRGEPIEDPGFQGTAQYGLAVDALDRIVLDHPICRPTLFVSVLRCGRSSSHVGRYFVLVGDLFARRNLRVHKHLRRSVFGSPPGRPGHACGLARLLVGHRDDARSGALGTLLLPIVHRLWASTRARQIRVRFFSRTRARRLRDNPELCVGWAFCRKRSSTGPLVLRCDRNGNQRGPRLRHDLRESGVPRMGRRRCSPRLKPLFIAQMRAACRFRTVVSQDQSVWGLAKPCGGHEPVPRRLSVGFSTHATSDPLRLARRSLRRRGSLELCNHHDDRREPRRTPGGSNHVGPRSQCASLHSPHGFRDRCGGLGRQVPSPIPVENSAAVDRSCLDRRTDL